MPETAPRDSAGEAWNTNQRVSFVGKSGHIETNNPARWAEIGLAMVMDAIAFYNAWRHGKRLSKIPFAKPIFWGQVDLMGHYSTTK
jgi:hypothetical protein